MCNILEYTATVIGHTMRYAMEICLQNVFTFDHTVQAQFNFRSLVLSCFTLFFALSHSLFVFYRRTETILFNDRSHTFNANARRTIVAKAIGHHDMCPSSCFSTHTRFFYIVPPSLSPVFSLSLYLFIFVCLNVLS